MSADPLPEPPDLPDVEESGTRLVEEASPGELGHGVHADVPDRIYHGRVLGLASKSALDLIRRSPSHYLAWFRGHDRKVTPALAFGSAFDCALLTPDVFARRYVVEPEFGDCRFKENKAERKRWIDANKGKERLPAADMEAIEGMVAKIRNHEVAANLVRSGQPQLTIRWRDDETGLECKARSDFYREDLDLVVDVKTTEDARADGFAKSVAKYGYHRQDAFYRDGFAAIGKPLRNFVFLAIEKEPPYELGVHMLDEEGVERGRASIRADMATLAECVRTGNWPGYPPGIQVLKLLSWAA